jgi:U3 small nucleolar RNA-associated protein 11
LHINLDASFPEKTQHTIYLDTKADVDSFNASEYFDTPEELVTRKFNRPKRSQVADFPKQSSEEAFQLNKARQSNLRELASRLKRDEKLTTVGNEMQVQKNMMGKGQMKKVGSDAKGLPVYKWRNERKK